MRRRVLVAALLGIVVAAGACGGTDFRRATFGEQKYIDAAAAGLRDSSDKPAGITEAQIVCLARAVVHGIGVARLRAAGVRADDLRDSSYDIPKSVAASLSAPEREQRGALVQACHLGAILGPMLTPELGSSGVKLTASEVRCVAESFDRPAYRQLVAALVVSALKDDVASNSFAQLFLDCVSFGRLIATQAPFPLANDEIACVDREVRASTAIRRALADKIAGGSGDSAEASRAMTLALGRCLSPEHLRRLGQFGTGSLLS